MNILRNMMPVRLSQCSPGVLCSCVRCQPRLRVRVSLQICGEKGPGARHTRAGDLKGGSVTTRPFPLPPAARCVQAEQVDRRASPGHGSRPAPVHQAGHCTGHTWHSPGAPWHQTLWVSDPGLLAGAGAGLPPCRSRSRLCPAHRTLTYSASGPIPDFSGQAPSQLTVNCRTGRKLSPTSPLFWFSSRF